MPLLVAAGGCGSRVVGNEGDGGGDGESDAGAGTAVRGKRVDAAADFMTLPVITPDAAPDTVPDTKPGDRCSAGARQCAGNVRQICDGAGQWQDELTCPVACTGGNCTGACIPGTATRELLVNPSFDMGETGWTNPGITIVYPANGNGADGDPEIAAQSAPDLAWLGGLNREDDIISQTVTIPARAASVTLSFSYAIVTAETSAAALDVMDAQIVAGGQTTTVLHLSDNDVANDWTRFTVLLPAGLAGQSITVQFHSLNNASRITSFYVDTVSLLATLCQ